MGELAGVLLSGSCREGDVGPSLVPDSKSSPPLRPFPQIEGAGLPTPLCQAPLRDSGHWAIPGFPGLTCIASGSALLAGREAGLEPSSAAGARQPRASGQTLVFRFKFRKTQKQPSSTVPGENPRQGCLFESQMGGGTRVWGNWRNSIGNGGPRGRPERREERA